MGAKRVLLVNRCGRLKHSPTRFARTEASLDLAVQGTLRAARLEIEARLLTEVNRIHSFESLSNWALEQCDRSGICDARSKIVGP